MLGILSCVYLMLNLPILTWIRFLVWLDLGMLIYWFYGRTHSPLSDEREKAARSAFENVANFVFVMGALAVFNTACIAVLAYMTELGLTTETIAKWHEIGVTAEEADVFGLKWLAVSAVILAAGFGLRKASSSK